MQFYSDGFEPDGPPEKNSAFLFLPACFREIFRQGGRSDFEHPAVSIRKFAILNACHGMIKLLKRRPALFPDYDRAAPLGTGTIKLGGNYGASLKPAKIAKEKGFPIPLFMDPKTHQYVDEFGTSNFFGITKDGVYATPDSPSILGSITNKSLQQIAEDLGMKVERRHIHRDELGNFAEIGACGTAVVITPISEIVTADKVGLWWI